MSQHCGESSDLWFGFRDPSTAAGLRSLVSFQRAISLAFVSRPPIHHHLCRKLVRLNNNLDTIDTVCSLLGERVIDKQLQG